MESSIAKSSLKVYLLVSPRRLRRIPSFFHSTTGDVSMRSHPAGTPQSSTNDAFLLTSASSGSAVNVKSIKSAT